MLDFIVTRYKSNLYVNWLLDMKISFFMPLSNISKIALKLHDKYSTGRYVNIKGRGCRLLLYTLAVDRSKRHKITR